MLHKTGLTIHGNLANSRTKKGFLLPPSRTGATLKRHVQKESPAQTGGLGIVNQGASTIALFCCWP